MAEVVRIDEQNKKVFFDDNTHVDFKGFIDAFQAFFKNRIAGETVTFSDMERFMSRTSAKNLKFLMKGKKMEGYLEGSMDKLLTKGQKIAVGTILAILIGAAIAYVIFTGGVT